LIYRGVFYITVSWNVNHWWYAIKHDFFQQIQPAQLNADFFYHNILDYLGRVLKLAAYITNVVEVYI